jgi:hypothetical protein
MIAGSFVFMPTTYCLPSCVAMARALDFALPRQKEFPLPLSVDAHSAAVGLQTNRGYEPIYAYLARGTQKSRQCDMALLFWAQLG